MVPGTDQVLITGATGVLGEQIVLRYLRHRPGVQLLLLLRGPDRNAVSAKYKSLQAYCLRQGVSPDRFRRMTHPVSGDICDPGLGLTDEAEENLKANITSILHCAATTQFTVSLPEGLRMNRDGTRHVLEFAAECQAVERIACLSTAFVAGRRIGVIREEELEHDAGFVNFYEHSKYEAELEARRRMNLLPVAVYRLSTMLGEAATGAVRGLGAIHACLRLYYRGLTVAMPGRADSMVHLLPVDYAAEAVFRLFEEHFQAGRTVHVIAPSERILTLDEFLRRIHQAFLEVDPTWHRRGIEVPPIVDLDTFNLLRESAELVPDPSARRIMRILSYFAPQQAYPKEFVSSLPSVMDPPPSLADYLPGVINYCVGTHWGRHLPEASLAAAS